MSLVEQALRKMQAAARVGAPAPGEALAAVPDRKPADPSRIAAEHVKAGHRVSAELPAQPVLHLDLDALRREGLMPPALLEHQIAQQYRRIKRPLLANAFGASSPHELVRTIMVASAMPGEGKTFSSINLAMSIAREKNVEVLLIDADIPKPHISRLFGVPESAGLTDALRDRAVDPEALIRQTDVANLRFLSAGSRVENATELLASERMRELVEAFESANPRRIVILDSPPLLLTTESHAMAQAAGQIVVVVRAGQTDQQVLLNALSYLADRPKVFLILNQSSEDAPSGYYYHAYGDQFREPKDV